MDGINEDPESPLNLSQSNNLIFYISRNHSLATKVDDVTSLYPQDTLLSVQEGRTVLHWVCALGDLPKANAVLSIPGVDVNLQDGAGWTPLMIAVSAGKEDIVDRLLEIPETDVTIQNRNGATALYLPHPLNSDNRHYAASKNRIHSSKSLLAKSIAPLRIKDTQGSLPIHRAASIGSTTLVNLYMFPSSTQKSASPINASDRFGMTPLHHACAEGHVETALLLVELGADTDRIDREGNTPLQCAPDDKTKDVLRRAFDG